jgi:hypothetical protein
LPTNDVHVEIAGLALTLELRDLGFDGFGLVASKPFWRGMTHRFTFRSASGLQVTLVAKAVHCYALPEDGDRKFVTGWEFMAGSAERTAAAIGQLFAAANDAPSPLPAA